MSDDLNRLGAHLIVGLSGPKLEAREAKLLKALRPAGIIIFSRNIDKHQASSDWPQKLRRLISEARQHAGRERFLVSIDHEGGKVHRVQAPATHFPTAYRYANQAQPVAEAMGRELRSLSCNLSFAPVLDVFSEPRNTVIAERAFAKSPERVSECSQGFIAGLESQGVLACGKHFPGHGATVLDSHFGLPTLDASLDILDKRELPPFVNSIARGIRLIMSAHVVCPALDPEFPATLSRNVITGLLRKRLGYKHAVISDDLGMKALGGFGLDVQARNMLNAGVDLLLVGNIAGVLPLERAQAYLRHIREALESGGIDEKLLESSCSRVEALFDHLEAIQSKAPLVDLECLGCASHQALCAQLSS